MDDEQIMNELYKRNKYEIDCSMKDTHEISKCLRRTSGMSDDGNMKYAGRIPGVIYMALQRIYGKLCWNDDNFVRAFFKAYSRFRITNRP